MVASLTLNQLPHVPSTAKLSSHNAHDLDLPWLTKRLSLYRHSSDTPPLSSLPMDSETAERAGKQRTATRFYIQTLTRAGYFSLRTGVDEASLKKFRSSFRMLQTSPSRWFVPTHQPSAAAVTQYT